MTCREGTTWDGKLLSEQIVSTLDIGVCPGEFRSITFETSFELKAPRTCVFTTESDDGSGVFVDGALVLDNDLSNTHGAQTKTGTIALGPGVHDLLVKYFNGPGGARLTATLESLSGKPVPISVAGFVDEFVFFVTGPKDAVHVR
jgi:hexosaminidase